MAHTKEYEFNNRSIWQDLHFKSSHLTMHDPFDRLFIDHWSIYSVIFDVMTYDIILL